MKQLFTIALALFCVSNLSFGQQAVQYSMYMLNKFRYNAGYAGLDNSLSITAALRKQWVGIEGTPSTQHVNLHMPLYIANGGIGLSLENDVIGANRNSTVALSYNVQVPVGDASLLSIGGGAGIIQRSLDGTKLRSSTGNYGPDPGVIDHQDNFLPVGIESAMAPSFRFGLYFLSESFELGLSANNLLESAFNYPGEPSADIRLKRNYFLTLAYNLNIGSSLSLHPSVFVKSDISQTQIDFSALVKYNDNIFGGASFRGYNAESIDAIVFIAGIKLSEKLSLAYSYDMTLSELNTLSSGSHEVMLNYNLNQKIGAGIPPKIIYNPRFL